MFVCVCMYVCAPVSCELVWRVGNPRTKCSSWGFTHALALSERLGSEDITMTTAQMNGKLSNSLDSSPQKPDRPPCGPGPPQTQPYGKTHAGEHAGSPPSGLPWGNARQRSISGGLNKKGSVRNNGDVIKRSRIQTAYELSQDLLEKQIEMLERKYGGVKARNAALTIQRAFRRYTMVKKFTAITAMAKAEKRLSRRFQALDIGVVGGTGQGNTVNEWQQDRSGSCDQCGTELDAEMVIRNNFAALYRELREDQGSRPPRPVRSMSMRERRSLSQSASKSVEVHVVSSVNSVVQMNTTKDGNGAGYENPGLPRSQSASTPRSSYTVEGESDLSDRDTPSYSQFEESCMYYTPTSLTPCPHHSRHTWVDPSRVRNCHYSASDRTGISLSVCDSSHYYTSKEAFLEDSGLGHESSLSRDSIVRQTITTIPSHQNNGTWSQKESVTKTSVAHNLRPSGNVHHLQKKVPPEVPKRTSSISSRSTETKKQSPNSLGTPSSTGSGHHRGAATVYGTGTNELTKTAENGSLCSVQSSGSDSSLSMSTDRTTSESIESDSHREVASPIWKRKGQPSCPGYSHSTHGEDRHMSHTEASTDNIVPSSKEISRAHSHSNASYQLPLRGHSDGQQPMYKVSETIRKRQYRVGLNLFNKKPERGITYLIQRGFLENSPQGVARFLISRKGLSKQMIGEYLGNLQNPFNMTVLDCFAQELDLSGMQVDVALRKFQTYFRMPGEAQKIERLMEVFGQRYCQCNRDIVARFRSPDTVFVLAFAIIMLNTDLHTPNLKPDRRMKLEDFVKNLRDIDDGGDIDRDMLVGIYERVKANEFKPGSDHVTQVLKVQSTIVGKKPNLALPHRRLVCYCRLYEIPDIYKKERPGVHQREVFLFNDLLVITKIFSKKKNSVTYTFRHSFPLCGMMVTLFEVPYYPYGIRLSQRVDNKVLVTFNARNEHDRCKFAEDLRESISEMDEMENLRIEAELERQKSGRSRATTENRDSGVADVEVSPHTLPREHETERVTEVIGNSEGCDGGQNCDEGVIRRRDRGRERERSGVEGGLKRSALSNSLLDIHDQFPGDKPQRRGSVGSLDSGMSISFHSTSASTVSRDSSPQNIQPSPSAKVAKPMNHQQSFLGGLFGKKERKSSRTEEPNPFSRSTEV